MSSPSPRGFHQPCRHRDPTPSVPTPCCVTCLSRDAKLRALPGPARLPRHSTTATDAGSRSRTISGRFPTFPSRASCSTTSPPCWRTPRPGTPRCDFLADAIRPHQPDLLVGIESRGFLVAAPLALKLDCGFVMVRKKGKLPGATIPPQLQPRIRHRHRRGAGRRRFARPARGRARRPPGHRRHHAAPPSRCCSKVGADVRAAACIIELAFLNGRGKLNVPFFSVVSYDS